MAKPSGLSAPSSPAGTTAASTPPAPNAPAPSPAGSTTTTPADHTDHYPTNPRSPAYASRTTWLAPTSRPPNDLLVARVATSLHGLLRPLMSVLGARPYRVRRSSAPSIGEPRGKS